MDTTLSDTMPSAAFPAIPAADGGAPGTPTSAKGAVAEAAARAPARAPYTLLDGIKLASGVISVARGLKPVLTMLRVARLRDPIAWIGLARRRSPFATLALFGAGAALGAGAGLLLASTSGAKLRSSLVERWKRDVAPALARLEIKAENTVEKAVEMAAEKVGGGAHPGGHRIAPWVSESTASIQDSPAPGVDVTAATSRAPYAAPGATPTVPPDHEHAAMADSEAAKPARTHGAAGYRFG